MKKILILVLTLLSGSATAATIILLPNAPVPPGIVNLHWEYCTGNSFSGDSVVGICKFGYGAGRSTPIALYHVTWDFVGNVTLGAKCAPADHCVLNYGGAPLVPFGASWYYYVTTQPNGAHKWS